MKNQLEPKIPGDDKNSGATSEVSSVPAPEAPSSKKRPLLLVLASLAIDSGAQYIRSESAKPFNAARYRWEFKENILTDSSHEYHLNYLTPNCAGSDTAPILELQAALSQLQKV